MISFKNIAQAFSGGPTYLNQNMFNLNVIVTYGYRKNFDDFDDFWFGEIYYKDTAEEVKVIDMLFQGSINDHPKDDYLKTQYSEACIKLENYLSKKYGLNSKLWDFYNTISSYAVDYDPNGDKLKTGGSIFADSHKEPEKRIKLFMEDFKRYEKLLKLKR